MVKKGWKNYDKFQSKRHSNARKFGSAGGKYASMKPKKKYFISEPFGLSRELQPKDKFYTEEEERELELAEVVDEFEAKVEAGDYDLNEDDLITFMDEQEDEEGVKISQKTKLEAIKQIKRDAKDSDGDGVVDKFDCEPNNPKKQDYELSPSKQKSFYGKAEVIQVRTPVETRDDLRSYDTIVASISYKDGKKVPVVYGTYSQTTLKHIKDFLKQNGFKAETSKQIMKDYGGKRTSSDEPDMAKVTGMVASLGDLFANSEKEKNDWKLRMLKAGLEPKGLQIPDDWDKLSEAEKKRRLDKVIAVTQGKA